MRLVILGVDCSSKQSSVCVMQDGRVIYTAVQATNTTHSQNFLPMIEAALTVCSYTPKDVDLYAPITILFLLCFLKYLPRPVIVPPVPTPATTTSIAPLK